MAIAAGISPQEEIWTALELTNIEGNIALYFLFAFKITLTEWHPIAAQNDAPERIQHAR